MLASFYGYPLLDASFEAASVTGNVGLSIGDIASMPALLKVYYIFAMYLGRLEFLSCVCADRLCYRRNQKEMFKKSLKKAFARGALIVLTFSSAAAAEAIPIDDLIEHSMDYDGKKVTVQGEAIGEALSGAIRLGKY